MERVWDVVQDQGTIDFFSGQRERGPGPTKRVCLPGHTPLTHPCAVLFPVFDHDIKPECNPGRKERTRTIVLLNYHTPHLKYLHASGLDNIGGT